MKKKVKKIGEKYVTERTFEKHMRSVAKSFADNAEVTAGMLIQLKSINEVSTIILKEIKTIHEDNKYFRESISSLHKDGFSYDKRIDNLDTRVEKLELKLK